MKNQAALLALIVSAVGILSACTIHNGQIYIAMSPEEVRTVSEAGLVCRTERPTGSNMPKRICASEKEWVEFDEAAEQASEDMMRNMNSSGTSVVDGGSNQ